MNKVKQIQKAEVTNVVPIPTWLVTYGACNTAIQLHLENLINTFGEASVKIAFENRFPKEVK